MWNSDSFPTVGNTFANPSYSAVVKLTHTITPSLLNEVAFNYNGNTISIQPTGIYKVPSGWDSSNKLFSGADPLHRLPEVDLGAPIGTNYNTGSWPWRTPRKTISPATTSPGSKERMP